MIQLLVGAYSAPSNFLHSHKSRSNLPLILGSIMLAVKFVLALLFVLLLSDEVNAQVIYHPHSNLLNGELHIPLEPQSANPYG